ncbi:HNH endonuclease [Micromonospora tulbaghiae]|uniref:HNH endonuclease signature motif containing protein n=1 Tax=Micromonospora tulbaghiae TaxID=479978 RepID=UPI003418836C
MAKRTFRVRLLEKTQLDRSGCWLWTAAKNAYGYGVIGLTGQHRTVLAHRATYEMFVGPIPDGHDLDHLCRVRHCVSPAHLEPVTRRINLLRGAGETARNAAKTHCPKGHPYSGANLIVRKSGQRYCRTCHNSRKRAARLR